MHVGKRRSVGAFAFCASILLSPLLAHGQDRVPINAEYDKLLAGRSTISALGTDLFGDNVSLYDGSLSFRHVDVSLPGNDSLAVEVARKFVPRQWNKLSKLFGDWELDIPHLEGVFQNSWLTELSPSTARCSKYSIPPVANGAQGGSFSASEYWAGNFLVLPGRSGGGEILIRSASTPAPTDGQSYPLATRDGVVFRCIVLGSGPSEGFEAVTPDGTRYRFDKFASRTVKQLEKGSPFPELFSAQSPQRGGGGGVVPLSAPYYWMHRKEVWILPSLVTDKFGNTVTYTWDSTDPWKLLSIVASDGRSLTLSYVSGTHRVASVSDGTRTWNYSYQASTLGPEMKLSQVTLPDSSQWTFNMQPLRDVMWDDSSGGGSCDAPGDAMPNTGTGTMTHPSGAQGSFTLTKTWHGRSWVPRSCYPDSFGYAYHPLHFLTPSLTQKTLSGPGMSPQTWSYAWGPHNACWTTSCNGSSPTTKTVTVTAPDASVTRYTFGNRFRVSEGQLLQIDAGWNGSSALRTTVNTYVPINTGPYPNPVGSSLQPRGTGYMGSRHTPVQSRTIAQQGQNFTWQVSATCGSGSTLCFDSFARPTKLVRGGTRTETMTYADNTVKWVLGQLSQTTINGTVSASATYDSTFATQLTFSSFGKLLQTLTWDTTSSIASGQRGTILTATDGNSNTTSFSSWKRGIPQVILYPDTTSEWAAVNDLGWITSTTDENGFYASYAHDPMGRLASITYPTGDTTAWNTTYQTFESIGFAEYGISGGHWRQTITTGNRVRINYYDALWRAVLTREYDAGNMGATQRFQRFAFDHDGKTTFASYAGSTDTLPTGIWTQYDALGRVTSSSQDSELGSLTSLTAYLTGFQTRVTDPKGNQTTTSFLTFDEPTTEWPVLIAHPAGAYTHILRDIYGKPTELRRSNSSSPTGGSVALSRFYVYRPDYQTLCKLIEPESGATVQDLDGAGNLAWSASGLYMPSTSDCNLTEGQFSGRAVTRTYDTRNRLSTLSFPDGRGNQSWTYTPDGLPATITTNNASGAEQVVNAYSYNKRRMLTGESVSQPGWYTWSLGYGFDANGNLGLQTYPTGLAVYLTPNALGQPTHLYDQYGTNYASGVSYYPNGAIAGFTYGNGIVHTMQQNARKLPSRSTDGTTIDLGYAFDQNGNVASILDYVDGSQSRGMSYDALDRLTQTTSNMFGTAQFSYDVLDNLTHVAVGASFNYPARDQGYCYDSAWRLTSIRSVSCAGGELIAISYDLQGNVASKSGQVYGFDYGNRLRSAPGPELYRYDGHGRRVLNQHASGNILSQYGQGGQMLYSENARTSKQMEHVYLSGSLVGIRESNLGGGSTQIKYQHTDALGSPIATTNASQGVIERTGYEPYGAQVNRPLVDGVGYTGHVQDAATGLTYMQQRYYDPLIGRFLSVDPVTASSATGANFNRYWYGNDNPYGYSDPDGREGVEQEELRLPVCPHGSCGATTYVFGSGGSDDEGDRPQGNRLPQDLGNYFDRAAQGDWWGAFKAGLTMIKNSWTDAFSTKEGAVLTAMAMIPIVGVEANIARAEYNLTRTVRNNLATRPYINSPLTVGEIRATGAGVRDPGGVPGALRYDVPGSYNGSQGTYELVVHPETNTIYHFLFRSN